MGYATNPHHKRGLPRGEAAALAAPLMNARLEPRSERLELCAPTLLSANNALPVLVFDNTSLAWS